MSIEDIYSKLATRADDETNHLASITRMLKNSSIQTIIQMGTDVLPFLFNNLAQKKLGCDWRMASISIILEVNNLPIIEIPEQFLGRVREMERIYVEYGKKHNWI